MTWKISIDTGGTFTDAYAIAPDGQVKRAKVLSSSTLRLPVLSRSATTLTLPVRKPDGFFAGFAMNGSVVTSSTGDTITVDREDGEAQLADLSTGEEAPVLAIRLLTDTPLGAAFPPIDLRVGTTRGTNALLEHRGAPTALFTSPGFRDLLTIGDQRRPDLFALHPQRPAPLYQESIEHVSLEESVEQARRLRSRGISSVAIALKDSYLDPDEERRLAAALEPIGFENVSISSELAPLIKLLPRAQTAVVNAYLAPVIDQFIENVSAPLEGTEPLLMSSSGGLEPVRHFRAKDSLLSGPAGGVTGAIAAARAAGIDHIIAFDMGGTSTDVSRSSGQPAYQFEQRIGSAQLLSPSLKIETVAAGGGSICSLKPTGLSVGPESAGADPGPACYGRGGPLTLTDVNLLLGHLRPDQIAFPLDPGASQRRLEELREQITPPISSRQLLQGLHDIAIERMADAIRKISLREGYDPADHTLLAFGGAGPQHACALADRLGISQILIPGDAGLLSAYGIHQAQQERIAQCQVLQPLSVDYRPSLDELVAEARRGNAEFQLKRQIAELRLMGQDSSLQVEISEGGDSLREAFGSKFAALFGYRPPADKEIELVSLRVIVATPSSPPESEHFSDTGELHTDPFSTLVISEGWQARSGSAGSTLLTRTKPAGSSLTGGVAVEAELYRHRFASVVEEMGALLQRTAVSTNIKERADFSCALLDAGGRLVMSAPHIPVHLGALGVCVRGAISSLPRPLAPGDMLITNHPACGGSHLPDITVISPVFAGDELIAFLANRAHHAEIGGITPGSMPADATRLLEEGTIIPPTYLFRRGEADFEAVTDLFRAAEYPTRNLSDNLADLHAQAAANLRGVAAIQALPPEKVAEHLAGILERSSVPQLDHLPAASAEEQLDDGSTIRVSIRPGHIDFSGTTPPVHPGNLNATPAIVRSAVLYVLRVYLQTDIPLNEGILKHIEITLPECFLNPSPDGSGEPQDYPAVVGGNVETSQRLVDTLIKALGIQACSQGTMNNLIFGDATFGYYETIAGGTGASPDHPGCDAIHSHMTNTAITDPEILESRYPVKLRRFEIRRGSGGQGEQRGGDGVIREIEFLRPLTVSLLTQHRLQAPFGLNGAAPGACGRQTLVKPDGSRTELAPSAKILAGPGDRLIIETPGGGGANRPAPPPAQHRD